MGKSRIGYRLTEDAEYLISRYEDERCSCSTCGSPPCNRCENSCPRDVAEDVDEYWEIDPDYEEEEMTEPYLFKKGDIVERISASVCAVMKGKQYVVDRDQKTDSRRVYVINDDGIADGWEAGNFKLIRKADAPMPPPPKSEWFGYKYKVTPETSKLLQEVVFKDGGYWYGEKSPKIILTDIKYLFISDEGTITTGSSIGYFNEHRYPEKQPPQPAPYEFKVGDKVRVIDNRNSHDRKIGDFCYLVEKNTTGTWQSSSTKGGEHDISCNMHEKDIELVQPVLDKEDKKEDNGCTVGIATHKHQGNASTRTVPLGQDNLCPEVYDPDKVKIFIDGYELGTAPIKFKQISELTNQEDTTMTQLTTKRRVLNIQLLDNDAGLPVEHSLVAKFEEVVTEDTDEVTIQELISTGEVAKFIEAHNKVRTEQINLEIQNRTGNTVKLLPIKLKNLTWNIK